MRIVDEPTSYSWQTNFNSDTRAGLTMRVPPSPFSGPQHLQRLDKRCFKKTLKKYEYEFCPFSNVTQREVGSVWNSFHGILGVWQEWKIVDNHFSAMHMSMGEQCGVHPREIDVKLVCGKDNEILNVTEPGHCRYEMIFSTPLTCHQHSMLVYPALTKHLQHDWDQLLSEYTDEQITEKGYNKGMQAIFKKAGYIQEFASEESQLKEETPHKAGDSETGKRFSSLDTCIEAYESLDRELKQTKAQLQVFV